MKAYVARDFGRIVGAYWAPEDAGVFGAGEVAHAFVGLDGSATEYLYSVETTYPRGRAVTRRFRSGQRPFENAAAVRACQELILAAMQADQREAAARASHNNGPRDEWGNLISDMED